MKKMTRPRGEPVRVLYASYISAVIMMVIVLASAQALIQYTLYREVQSRGVAGTINLQELRTQLLLRNSILLLTDTPDHAQEIQQLSGTLAKWEAVQDAIYSGNDALNIHQADFPQDGLTAVLKVRPNYNLMDATLHHLLFLESDPKTNERAIIKDVLTIFSQEIIVLPGLNTLFNDMTLAADADVTQVRFIEIALFALALLTMTVEIVFVIRPAHHRLKFQVGQLNAYVAATTTPAPEAGEKKTETVTQEEA